jgi:short subunit dehydrogenase-like uncharacterized protein
MASSGLLVYGATGFSGRLIVQRALARGLRPALAGRGANAGAPMAREYGLAWFTARVDEPARLRSMMAGAKVLINAAGPFAATAGPLMDACIDTGTHYLDITGESETIEPTTLWNESAQRSGVMLMPATGFDVVASDCLAAHVARRLPGATTLRIGFHKSDGSSIGSLKTTVEMSGKGVWVRRQGRLVRIPAGTLTHFFDYGRGAQASLAVSLGDVSSAFYSTGIGNIEAYMSATLPVWTAMTANQYWGWLLGTPPWQAFLKSQLQWLALDSSRAGINSGWGILVAEATDACGRIVCSRMHTGDVYWFTALSSIGVAEKVLAGEVKPGFQTPSLVYGPDFALEFEGARRVDL